MTLPLDPDVANLAQVCMIAAGWSPAAATAAIAALNAGTPANPAVGWTPIGAGLAALSTTDDAPVGMGLSWPDQQAVADLVQPVTDPGNDGDGTAIIKPSPVTP